MLIFVADLADPLSTLPPFLRFPFQTPALRAVSPTRVLTTVAVRYYAALFIAEYLIRACSQRGYAARINGRQRGNERDVESVSGACTPWKRKGPKGKDAGQGWFINNAKCLNIENSSALPKGDDKASVTCLRGTRCARLITYEWNCRRAFAIRAASARRQVSAIQFLKFHFVCRTDTYVMYGNAQRCVRSAPLVSGKTRRGFARISKLRAARAHHYYYYGRFPSAVNYTSRDINWIPSRDEETIDIFPSSPPRAACARVTRRAILNHDATSVESRRKIDHLETPKRDVTRYALRSVSRPPFQIPPNYYSSLPSMRQLSVYKCDGFGTRPGLLQRSRKYPQVALTIRMNPSLSPPPLSLSSLLFSINTRASLTSCPRARRSETNFNLARWLHGAYRQTSN